MNEIVVVQCKSLSDEKVKSKAIYNKLVSMKEDFKKFEVGLLQLEKNFNILLYGRLQDCQKAEKLVDEVVQDESENLKSINLPESPN